MIDTVEKKIVLYNSLASESHDRLCISGVKMFGEVFHPLLGGEDWFKQYEVVVPDVMQQKDGVSCGIYLNLTTLALLDDADIAPEEMYPAAAAPLDIRGIGRAWVTILEDMINSNGQNQ